MSLFFQSGPFLYLVMSSFITACRMSKKKSFKVLLTSSYVLPDQAFHCCIRKYWSAYSLYTLIIMYLVIRAQDQNLFLKFMQIAAMFPDSLQQDTLICL